MGIRTQQQTQARPQKSKRPTAPLAPRHKRFLFLAIGVLAANALLGFWLHEPLVERQHEERLQSLAEQQARRQAEKVTTYLSEVRQKLKQAVQAPGITEAVAALDPQTRAEQVQALSDLFANDLALRLIPRGSAQLERDHVAPIRFAELDFIRRAERRETTYPEMVRVEDSWQLHLIHPLPPEKEQPVVGTLLTTLDASELRRQLSSGQETLGQTRLIQKIPGSGTQLLVQNGPASTRPPYEIALDKSHWQLSFTPSPALVEQAKSFPFTWWLILCVAGSAGLAAAWVVARQTTREPADVKMSEEPPGDEPLQVANKEQPDQRLANPLYQQEKILDPDDADRRRQKEPATDKDPSRPELPNEIFRAYDIRGTVERQLTPALSEHIGRALGTEAQEQGETHMVVARDGRSHSPELTEALIRGITQTGCQVLDLGLVPTPVMYFATHHLAQTNSGVIVTASHNPAQYNGFKMVINGVTLADEAVQGIRKRIARRDYRQGEGRVETLDITQDYIDRISDDLLVTEATSVVIDAGNAVTGVLAPRLFESLGCRVIPLHCELDGAFPNHDPDPTQAANLQDLIAKVSETGADLGVAFDGDGDRLVLVTATGRIVWPDQLLMLFARDVLTRHPGADVVFDVKCSRQLSQLITGYGGRPIMWKTGHSPMKAKMVETQALLGGEYSGHIFFKERWYGFDDGLYAMARLLEILALREQSLDETLSAFPALPSTPEIKITVPERKKFAIIDALAKQGNFGSGKATHIDGLRVDFAKGWGLVRASNTSAALTLRFEAETDEALTTLQQLFKKELLKVDRSLNIHF